MPVGFDRWALSVHWGVVGVCVVVILVLVNLFQIVILARWAVVIAAAGPILLYHFVTERIVKPIGSCTLRRRRDL